METQGKLPKKHHDKAVGGGLAAHHNAGLQGSLWREARMAGAEEGSLKRGVWSSMTHSHPQAGGWGEEGMRDSAAGAGERRGWGAMTP